MSHFEALRYSVFTRLMLKIADWQERRFLWLLGGITALVLDLIAIFFFQGYLKLDACEMCVYIRVSMLVIFIGAMITAIYPKQLILRVFGYATVIWAIFKGIEWSWTLVRASAQYKINPFASTCSMTNLSFPLGLPLDKWLPSVFAPTGICGEVDWSFLSLDMGQWMLVIYVIYIALIGIMIFSALYRYLFFKFK